ncbi:alpha/beta hydrolase, partial [Pseudomonas capeferrum]|nr:alpha/beta hydrolase [Pseudomonas capeferrum]
PAIEVSWRVAGDHDLKPLKASGFSHVQHMQAAAEQVAEFLLK